jgi:hypothetical protein
MTVKTAVVYDNETGTPHAFAQVVAGGATAAATRMRPRDNLPDRVSGGPAGKKDS